jgi:hypothetical protein
MSPILPFVFVDFDQGLRHKLDATTSFLDLTFGLTADIASLHNNRDVGQATLAQKLGVTKSQKVDDRRSVLGGGVLAQILGAQLLRHNRPELSIITLETD